MGKFPALVAAALAVSSFCFSQTAIRRHPGARNARPPVPAPAPRPDLIFFNGIVYTGAGFAEDQPQVVQAIAIGRGKVLAIGTSADITRLAGPNTHLRDLDSASTNSFLFPGFNDAHTHLGEGGQTRLNLDLEGVKSMEDMLTRIAVFAEPLADGHWITGGRWDHTLWAKKVLPTRQDIDKVSDGHPTFLRRVDGHIGIANSAALAAAGVTGKTAAPQGGAIDLDAKGEPTGILRESAMDLVEKMIPPPRPEERRRGAELAIDDALAHGV